MTTWKDKMLIINNLRNGQRVRITMPSGEKIVIACDRSPVCLKLSLENRYEVDRIDIDGNVIPRPEKKEGYVNTFKKVQI
jgi:hypothetical protein